MTRNLSAAMCAPFETEQYVVFLCPLLAQLAYCYSVVPTQDAAIALVDNQLAANIIHEIFILVSIGRKLSGAFPRFPPDLNV